MVTSNKDFKMVKVSFKEIYTKFKVWAHDNGENEMSGKALGGSLIEREFIPKGISGQRFYVGLSLRKDEEPNNSWTTLVIYKSSTNSRWLVDDFFYNVETVSLMSL